MKYETKYKLGQKVLIVADYFDENHNYVERHNYHGIIDRITIGGDENEYRIIYEGENNEGEWQWIKESGVKIISMKGSEDIK